MALVRFQRRFLLYVIAAVAVLGLHAYLCYPAAVSRGHPPIKPFELIAVFLAPLGMIVPPLFDDGNSDYKKRFRRSLFVTAGFCFVWGIVSANLNSPRPHFGHLLGIVGLISTSLFEVIGTAIYYFLPALTFFYCYDGIAIGFWSVLRNLRSCNAPPTELPPNKALQLTRPA